MNLFGTVEWTLKCNCMDEWNLDRPNTRWGW